jgi:GT2 family glycosyltransferase
VIVIPFYKREDLVDNLLGSLLACAGELKAIGTLIVLVNDSPGYAPLDETICGWFNDIEQNGIEALYLCNSVNRGFIYSSNTGIWIADKLGAHCLLLNSDTVVVAGAISEMLSILESDEKFGFVNPRTNNATIATYGAAPTDADTGYSCFRQTHSLLPRFQIVPVAVGFCLLIRAEIIRFFGYLDPVYGFGYNEENDFIMRANRRGYSSVLANHCFVAHLGKASFSVLCEDPNDFDNINQKIFLSRYPEFKPAITRYFSSSRYHALRLAERENDVDIIIDIRTATKINNGTTKLIKALLPYLFRELKDLKLAIAAEPEVIEFLEIAIPDNVATIIGGAIDIKGALGFLFSQPFSNNVVDRLLLSCERIGFFMLDTIATDCLYIQQDGLMDLWDRVCGSGDLFIFNSDYTMSRFLNRYTFSPDALLVASTHSMNPAEYEDSARNSLRYFKNSAPQVLLFGNHYEHKGLLPALNALEGKGFDVTVFGAALSRDDVTSYPAGQLSDASLDEIWSRSDVLVFPSFYEGFGFPILEAVARRKPIVLLDSELNREIFNRLGKPPSFFFLI